MSPAYDSEEYVEKNDVQEFPKDYVNPRGIPRVIFIESVEDHVQKEGGDVPAARIKLQEQHEKYSHIELRLKQKRELLRSKVPEIRKTLQTVEFLKKQQEDKAGESAKTNFLIADNVYAEADVEPVGTCGIWLGANVMVEYSYDEAIELLQRNLKLSVEQLNGLNEDLSFIRDMMTTTEVNISRVHNYGVMQKKQKESTSSKK